jgi:protein phosphatase inhibitor 2
MVSRNPPEDVPVVVEDDVEEIGTTVAGIRFQQKKHPKFKMNTNVNSAVVPVVAPQVLPVGQKRGIAWDEPTISEHDLLRGTRTKITEPKTPYRPMLGIEQLVGPSSSSISEQRARESASSAPSSSSTAAAGGDKGVLGDSTSTRRVRSKDFGMATDGLGGILALNDPRVMSALAKHNAELNSGKHDDDEASGRLSASVGGGGGGVGEKEEFEKKRKAHYGNVKELLARSKKAIEEDDDDDEDDDDNDDDDES